MQLQCKLVRSDSDELAGSAGGTAILNENEWAMQGQSAQIKPEERRPEYFHPGQPAPPQEEQIIRKLDKKAEGPHPLADPNFPFRVKMMIDGKERKGEFKGNDYIVTVRKGERYQLWIENHTGQIILMRALVDGLNTLPEKETTKGVETVIVGKRASLDEARHWELDPAASNVFCIPGFVTEVGVKGKARDFEVVDAAESLAARRKFTDQIGLITVAFYSPTSNERAVGTRPADEERDLEIQKAHNLKPADLLVVVHIRYVEVE